MNLLKRIDLKFLVPYIVVFIAGIFMGGGSINYTKGDMKLELHGRNQEKAGLLIQVDSLRKQLEECR